MRYTLKPKAARSAARPEVQPFPPRPDLRAGFFSSRVDNRSSAHGKQAVDHVLCATQIACAEQVEVVEHVIQVVHLAPLTVTWLERPGVLVGAVELGREAAEQMSHRQIRLAVSVVNRGIEDHRLAICTHCSVAAP